MHNPIIVALDGLTCSMAREWIEKLHKHVWGFKFNDLMHGVVPNIDKFKVMLDPKLHDIPNTVKNTCCQIQWTYGVPDIVTVHASGGIEMMHAAVDVFPDSVAAVTVLTSLDTIGCQAIYNRYVSDQVAVLATLAGDANVSYLVCSGQELETLKDVKIPKIVPGIRPRWFQDAGDQKRVIGPGEAIKLGARFLVMGRPILQASDPVEACQKTLEEIQNDMGN